MQSGMNTQRTEQSTHVLSDEGEAPFEIVCHDTSAIERDAWLDLRRGGLGGSDIASAMGLSPFTSRYALWLDKIGEPVPFTESEYMKWGNRLEAPIALAFEEETGFATWSQPVMLRSRSLSTALANPDRFTIDPDGIAIVEIKNVGKHKAHEWVDGPPIHYRLQGQWYLFVSGHRRVYYAVLVGGQDFRIFQVERDDELIAEMVRQAEAFWTLVTLRRAPEIDESDSTANALKAQYATVERPSVEGGKELAVLVVNRQSVKTMLDTVEAQLQEIDNKIIALVGDAQDATVDGAVVVRRPSQSRTSLDIHALKRDYPAIASEYSKTSQYRVMKFPKLKEAK